MAERIVTPIGRVCFANVYEPVIFKDNRPVPCEPDVDGAKYSLTLVFDPGTDLKPLVEAAKAAAAARFPKGLPSDFEFPWRKCDDVDYDGFTPGGVFIKFSSQARYGSPIVLDPAKQPIDAKSERFYSGCYGRVSCKPFAYSAGSNKGVAFALLGVQKTGDGDRLGVNVADDFDALETAEGTVGASDDGMFF